MLNEHKGSLDVSNVNYFLNSLLNQFKIRGNEK
jgi:hypothetical protein